MDHSFRSLQNFELNHGICCFAPDISRAAEFRIFRGNSGHSLLQTNVFMYQFSTSNSLVTLR